MGRKRARKTTKPVPVNCANCNSACSPQDFKRLEDDLPNPELPENTANKTVAGSRHKVELNPSALPRISDALSTVFVIPRPDLSLHTLFICSHCSLVLAKAWTAFNQFRQLAINAPTSFLAPYMLRVKEEGRENEVETTFDLGIPLKLDYVQNAFDDSGDRDPLALSDFSADDTGSQDDLSEGVTYTDVIDRNRVIRIVLEPLKNDRNERHFPTDTVKSRTGSHSDAKSFTRTTGKTKKQERDERTKRLIKLSKLKEKFLSGRVDDNKNRALKKRSRENAEKMSKQKTHGKNGIRIFTGEKSICPLCQKSFNHLDYLKAHMNTTHRKHWVCSFCEETFTFRGDYTKHKKDTHIGKGALPCTLCDGTYTNQDGLRRHMILMHKTEKTFQCETCKRNFMQESTLEKHKKSGPCKRYHSIKGVKRKWRRKVRIPGAPVDPRPNNRRSRLSKTADGRYVCSTCKKDFKSRNGLWKHRKFVHNMDKPAKETPTPTELGYPCPICGNHYKNPKTLWKHHREMHYEKNLPCKYPNCGRFFSTQNILNKHHLGHVGRPAKEFMCPEPDCYKGFKSKVGVALHMKNIHLDKGKFPCPHCPSSYATEKLLANHNITHLPPAIVCEHCGNLYKHKKDLKAHQLTVHFGESSMKHACLYCPRRFVRQELLRLHMVRANHLKQDSMPDGQSEPPPDASSSNEPNLIHGGDKGEDGVETLPGSISSDGKLNSFSEGCVGED